MRVFRDTVVIQRIEHLPNAVIDLLSKIAIYADRARAFELLSVGTQGPWGEGNAKYRKEGLLIIGQNGQCT